MLSPPRTKGTQEIGDLRAPTQHLVCRAISQPLAARSRSASVEKKPPAGGAFSLAVVATGRQNRQRANDLIRNPTHRPA